MTLLIFFSKGIALEKMVRMCKFCAYVVNITTTMGGTSWVQSMVTYVSVSDCLSKKKNLRATCINKSAGSLRCNELRHYCGGT